MPNSPSSHNAIDPIDASPWHAQSGEDRLLSEFFGAKTHGFYVEVGAYDGITDSNSFYFEQAGWNGLLVEADPELAAQCERNRPGATVFSCAAVAPHSSSRVRFEVVEGWKTMSSLSVEPQMLRRVEQFGDRIRLREISVAARTLNDILDEAAPAAIDFLTLDVEGHEWAALQGLDLAKWRPSVLIIERNTHFPDRRIMGHLHRNRYRYLRTTGVNDWFVADEIARSGKATYRRGLWLRFYLPKYLTLWKPLLITPLRSAIRTFLIRSGWFEKAKSLFK